MTPSRNESATFRFVAQYINHCATAIPTKRDIQKSSGATAQQGFGRQSGRRRSAKLVPTFADRGVSRGQRNGYPTAVNLFTEPGSLIILFK